MAGGLTFQSVLATGSGELGDFKGPGGAGLYDLFFESIDLPGFADGPALLVLAAKNVEHEKNFITINAPREVTDRSFEGASSAHHFVWRVLPNPTDTWVLQMHQINPGKLKPSGNILGIHSRNEEGEAAGVRDEFAVARLFIFYFAA